MAVPSLPAQGSTSWFTWAQGLHNEVVTGRLSDTALTAAFVVKASLTLNVKDYGAKGDGTTDDTAAINAALAAVPQLATVADAYDGTTARPRNAAIYFPDGIYAVSSALVLPQNVNVIIAPGATLKATAAMTAVIDTAVATLHQDGFIDCQGIIDCNGLADYGIYLRRFARYVVRTPRVYSPAAAGVVLGDTAATTVSYEGQVIDPYVWRANGQAVPVGSVGVWTRNATDCFIGGTGSVILGCAIGTRNDKNNNTFKSIHPWGYPPNSFNGNSLAYLPTTSFLDNAVGAIYIDCYADTPSAYGWRFTADDPQAQIIGGRLYNAAGTTDNVVVAVQVDAATKGTVDVLGLSIRAISGSARVAADFAGTTGGMRRIGTRSTNVVTVLGDSNAGASVGVLTTVTGNTTLTASDFGAQVNAPSGANVLLPAASSVVVGKTFTIHSTPSSAAFVNLRVVSSGVIDGRQTVVLGRGDSVQVYSDGTTWSVLARTQGVAVIPFTMTSPAVSGTAYQNLSGRTLYVSSAYTPTGAGSVTLEISRDGSTYSTVDVATFSGAGSAQYMKFALPDNHFYRATASGATLGAVTQFG